MSFSDFIKGDKKLTLGNWRYRILHWTFGVNPRSLEEANQLAGSAGIPRCVYTHYCPLFHFTNLLLCVLPLIILARLITLLVRLFVYIFNNINSVIQNYVDSWIMKNNERDRKKQREQTNNRGKSRQSYLRKTIYNYLKDLPADNYRLDNYSLFIEQFEKNYDIYLEQEGDYIHKCWLELAPKIRQAKEKRAAKRERMKQYVYFWITFSRAAVKTIIYTFYAALAVVVVWFSLKYGGGLLADLAIMFWWIIGLNWWGILMFGGKIILTIMFTIGFGFVLGFALRRYKSQFIKGMSFILPPFEIVGSAIVDFSRWVCSFAESAAEFMSMFYEENCPKITIVEDEIEAEISAGAE